MYQYKIAAYTAIGLGPFSTPLFFQTMEAGKEKYNFSIMLHIVNILAPLEAPDSLTLVHITSTTVTLTWDSPPLDTHNGIIREYIIQVIDSNNAQSLSVML